jgi:transposase-like protein
MREPTFHEIMQWDANEARAHLEAIRWPKGPVCPNGCASVVYRFEAKTRRKVKGVLVEQPPRQLLKCKSCKRQFTATVGTIFEDSHIPLNKWLAAIYLMCASKKGVSAHQIHRMLAVTYKTAWYMCHRVRAAMKDRVGLLSGTIEADETYVGGRPRGHMKHRSAKYNMSERIQQAKAKKTAVFGILERGGRVRTVTMPNANKRQMQDAFMANVSLQDSVLVTDESNLYDDIRRLLPHRTVRHADEYVTGDGIHTQGIENFWSILKRQLYGTHHHVQPGFLSMYADEVAFKHNTRKINDGERFASALEQVEGTRLAWRASSKGSQPAS